MTMEFGCAVLVGVSGERSAKSRLRVLIQSIMSLLAEMELLVYLDG